MGYVLPPHRSMFTTDAEYQTAARRFARYLRVMKWLTVACLAAFLVMLTLIFYASWQRL